MILMKMLTLVRWTTLGWTIGAVNAGLVMLFGGSLGVTLVLDVVVSVIVMVSLWRHHPRLFASPLRAGASPLTTGTED